MSSQTKLIIAFSVACGIIVLILGLFLILIVYKYQHKLAGHVDSIKKLEDIHQLELLNSQIEIQEQTFQNISREIHDSVGQKLSLVKLKLNRLSIERTETFTDAIQLITTSLIELRDLGRVLSRDLIISDGLTKALEKELEYIRRASSIVVNLRNAGEIHFLKAEKELIIFRIVQEALHNIIKHSEANFATVVILYGKTFVRVRISDDGKGFDFATCKKGQGLTNIEKRVFMLGGVSLIKSTIGQGTKIEANIPVQYS